MISGLTPLDRVRGKGYNSDRNGDAEGCSMAWRRSKEKGASFYLLFAN